MYDVVTLGELLIDFTDVGVSENNMKVFERNAGGAVANVIAALAKLGAKTAFIGKVGDDMHGEFLRATLDNLKVDTTALHVDKHAFTTLAFVSLDENGERSFSFARAGSADTRLAQKEVPMDIVRTAKIFHFGSLSLTTEPSLGSTLYALGAAKQSGALISFDPNYRAPLWPNKTTAVNAIRAVLRSVDFIKISEEEALLITEESDYARAASAIAREGPSCVVITRGPRGADAFTGEGAIHADAAKVKVVDTTGAGDAFWGGFLYKFLDLHKTEEFLSAAISAPDLSSCMTFASKTAALSVQKRGGITSLPDLSQVLAYDGTVIAGGGGSDGDS